MDLNELRELIQILEESDLSEVEIDEKGRRIRLQKPAIPAAAPVAAPVVAAALEAAPAAAPVVKEVTASTSAPDVREAYESQGLKTIDAPMVGTFYISPAPGEDAYTKIGDQVSESQTVCIVEAMKLMNEVATKFGGIIEKVLVENGQPVEFGQPLFAVRPL